MKTIQATGITIYQFVWDIVDSNCFVICEENECLIFDPIDSIELFSFLSRTNTTECTIILTHAHFDHICGVNTIRASFPHTKVICSKDCSDNIQDSKKNLSHMANAYISFHNKTDSIKNIVEQFSCDKADETFEERSTYKWRDHLLTFQEMKGHSPDSLCCLLDGKYLFTGDTLLATPTITRFPGGNTKQFKNHDIPLLQKMLIPIETLFPGHGDVMEKSELSLILE